MSNNPTATTKASGYGCAEKDCDPVALRERLEGELAEAKAEASVAPERIWINGENDYKHGVWTREQCAKRDTEYILHSAHQKEVERLQRISATQRANITALYKQRRDEEKKNERLREALRWLASRPPLSVETVRSIADRIMEGVNLHPSSEVTYDQLKLRIRRELHGIGVAGSRVFETGPCWCDVPNPEMGQHMPECATARTALNSTREGEE